MSTSKPKGDHLLHQGKVREVLLAIASTKAGEEAYSNIVDGWYALGLALNVSEGALESIAKSCSRDKLKALHDMIKSWLIETDRPTWELLVEALRSPFLTKVEGIQIVASQVHQHYCSSQSGSGWWP